MPAREPDKEQGKGGGLLIAIFAVCLVFPLELSLGSLRLSPTRLFLLILFVPSVLRVLRGYGRPFGIVDALLLSAILWNTVSMLYNHPIRDVYQGIGILYIECCGAYFFGRAFVVNLGSYKKAISSLLVVTLALLPFAILENISGTDQYLALISKLGSTYPDVFQDPAYDRWGFDRAQGPFPHPIHFGLLFCSFLGVVAYGTVFSKNIMIRGLTLGSLILGTISSLSSGPLTALVVQITLGAWGYILRNVRSKWNIAFALFIVAYVGVDLLSNRTPFHVFASYLSFSEETAYDRIRIWEYGWINISNHPVFGVGLDDWERARFMTASIDMFWLIWGVQNGLPAFFFWISFWVAHTAIISRYKIVERGVSALRTGYIISSIGLFVAGWTVHFWNEIFVFYLFFMGSGLWFADPNSRLISEEDVNDADESTDLRPRYTRFGRIV